MMFVVMQKENGERWHLRVRSRRPEEDQKRYLLWKARHCQSKPLYLVRVTKTPVPWERKT